MHSAHGVERRRRGRRAVGHSRRVPVPGCTQRCTSCSKGRRADGAAPGPCSSWANWRQLPTSSCGSEMPACSGVRRSARARAARHRAASSSSKRCPVSPSSAGGLGLARSRGCAAAPARRGPARIPGSGPRQRVQPLAAVARQLVQAPRLSRIASGSAGAPPAPEPAQLASTPRRQSAPARGGRTGGAAPCPACPARPTA